MKIKVKSYNGELYPALTLGKEYEVVKVADLERVVIIDDSGSRIMTNLHKSGYLNGGAFEVVE